MSYTVTVQTTHEGEELVACFLETIGAMGVSIADAYDLKELLQNKSPIFWDYVDDALLTMDETVRVCGFFDERPDEEQIQNLCDMLAQARENMPVDMGSMRVVEGENLHDEDWLENWRQFYRPIVIGQVTVLPAWMQGSTTPVTVRINPSTAFGTGEHESTKMCLELLQSLPLQGKQVIDVGCGSGILGIAALKLGAEHCYFCDLDPDAVKNCVENIALNQETACTTAVAPLLKDCPVVADVVLANITADVLLMLSEQIRSYHKEGGYLIVSGIIAGREEQVVQAFVKTGYEVLQSRSEADWRAYLLQAVWN